MPEVEEPLTEASFRASGASRLGSPAPRNAPAPGPAAPPPPAGETAERAERPAGPSAATHTAFTASLRQQAPAAAPRWGWRGRVRRWTGGRVSPAVSPAEQRWNTALRAVQMTFGGPRTIAFVNPKGGAFKTTATLMAARTFGVHRGGGVVAIDGNETRGTLGERALPAAHGNTVRDLAAALEPFQDADAATSLGDLGQYVRGQGPAQFDVLASDERPDLTGQLDGPSFQRLHALLRRHYRLVLVDTGNNPRSSTWVAAVQRADLVVITTTVREDAASAALWTADLAEQHVVEPGTLRHRGVALVCDPGPGPDAKLRTFLLETFAKRCRAVLPIPYEPALAGGGQLDYTRLSPATHTAWLYACAAMASALSPEREAQAGREGRGNRASR
ncbi:MinD/ParA family ATP-binding protein [Streptomyces sp. 4N509B]|uniref:MinD/ParA family ATP-binding protein n=1 Tax=Streptomyces sp. 4N509B TaxID=3457413 RepID=UPI003FD50E3C